MRVLTALSGLILLAAALLWLYVVVTTYAHELRKHQDDQRERFEQMLAQERCFAFPRRC